MNKLADAYQSADILPETRVILRGSGPNQHDSGEGNAMRLLAVATDFRRSFHGGPNTLQK